VPFFICPNCGNRELSGERGGLLSRPKQCSNCGAPFLFELLDDYYPAPDAAFFVCDHEGRLLDVGRNGFELTGLKDEQVIGRPVREVLGLEWIDEDAKERAKTEEAKANGTTDPIETTLEWGVRSLGKRVAVHAEGDLPAEAVADVFPAYDDDGGMLLVLTPE
jgi:PAS domain S-box-containing protein